MHLISEVLDKQILDATGQNSGKADGIVARVRDGRPPLLIAIEVSPVTLIRRVSLRLARLCGSIDARLGAGRAAPYRIPWSTIEFKPATLRVPLNADDTPIMAVEQLARRLIARIPGA